MSEADQRTRVTQALRSLDAIAVENPVLPGTPDVNYVEGWIELKWLRAWPKKPDTIVVLKHFTKQQRIWHMRRRRAGGQSWVLLQCRREWLLLDGATAALFLNYETHGGLRYRSEQYWTKGLVPEELIECISQTQSAFLFNADAETILRERLQSGSASR